MVFHVVKSIKDMIDLEKTLVNIVLALVAILCVVLLFSSCKSKKSIVSVDTNAKTEQITKVNEEKTDKGNIEEDYTEIVYVLDTVQSVEIDNSIFNFQEGKVNYGSALFKVKEIKIKNAHISEKKNSTNKIYTNTEKTSQIEQNAVEKKKEKPTMVKVLKVSLFFALLIIIIFLLWRYTRH
jgi:Ca2+/Na+ antiporter